MARKKNLGPDRPTSQRCVWQPETGWQPLAAGGSIPDDRPVAWCSPTEAGAWAPIQPLRAGDQPVATCVWRPGEGWQPVPPAPAGSRAKVPAVPAGSPGPPTASQADTPESAGAGPSQSGADEAAHPSSAAPASPPAALPGTGSLPPEVAAFYALLFSPLPSATGPQAVSGPQAAPGLAAGPAADAAAPSLWDSFRGFTARLGDALNEFVTNVTSLEVDTFTSTNPRSVHLDPDPQRSTGENLALLARTLVAFDGDTQLSLPAQRGAIDPVMIQLHLQMVHEAQYNRAQFLQMMAELGSQLLGVFKPQ